MRTIVVVLAAALVLAAPAAASERHPTQNELEGELVCPTCHTTLDQSDAPIARQMKEFVRERIAAGDTKSEIKDKLVAQLGKQVLAAPPKEGFDLVAWLLPIGGILVAAAALAVGAWQWSRTRTPVVSVEPGGIDPELERRLDDELARFDA